MSKIASRLLLAAIVVGAVFAVRLASAETTGPRHQMSKPVVKLSAVALNAAAASRTFDLVTEGWDIASIWIDYTHANNGALTLSCLGGHTASSTPAYTLTTCTMASGACTLNDGGTFATASLSAAKHYEVRFGVRGYAEIRCVIAHGGSPNASDLVTVTAVTVAE
jgi:hypothetical protein